MAACAQPAPLSLRDTRSLRQRRQPRQRLIGLMRFAFAALLLAFPGFRLAAAALTLEEIYASPSLFGTAPSQPLWSPDSSRLAFAWNDAGLPQRDLWVVDATAKEPRRLAPKLGEAAPVRELLWLNRRTLLSLRGSELWSTEVDSNAHRRLVELGEGAGTLALSPDDTGLSYLSGGDLWLLNLATLETTRLTDLGLEPLSSLAAGRYRRPEREVGPGIWGGPRYAWSPDGRSIAVHLVDRRDMQKVPFPDYLATETSPNFIRRGYPGDRNESRRVGLLDVESGELRMLDLPDPASHQIVGFSWSRGGRLLIDVASDTAEDRWLYTLDVADEQPQALWHHRRSTRIYTSFAATWLGDDILFLSDLGDRYGLYRLDSSAAVAEPQRLTDPAADVLGAPAVAGDSVFYASNAPAVEERHIYRLSPDARKTSVERITKMSGEHTAIPSPDGRQVALIRSSDTEPPELYLASTEHEDPQRITHSPLPAFQEHAWAQARYVAFPSRVDDYTLRARILEPVDLDRSQQYPVLFGPMYSNTVRNRWSGIYSKIQQLLVSRGYIVVQVDVRGSTGYGRDFREAFLGDFAGTDLEDIESAVAHISKLPYVAADRMGIWGSSYGGTLTIYTLLKKPGLFHAGAAAAAAVDPRFFGTDDVAIVRSPEVLPEAFANRAEAFAANLQDHLLIIHGMQDQIVPFKTTVVLAEALMREHKTFEFAFAAGATHSWSREAPYSRYLFGRMLEHFDRYLKP